MPPIAPVAQDSGTKQGATASWGRREVRPPLYIAALVASRAIPACTPVMPCLISNGKPPRLALVRQMPTTMLRATDRGVTCSHLWSRRLLRTFSKPTA
jgi:hypothetical protein